MALAGIEVIAVAHVGRQLGAEEVDREEDVLLGVAAARPGDVELFLADLGAEVGRREHRDDLAAMVQRLEDGGLPGAADRNRLAVQKDPRLRRALGQQRAKAVNEARVFVGVAEKDVELVGRPRR